MTTPKRNEAVAWRRRYICPQEGPSLWLPCEESDVPTLSAAGCYEIEPLYSAATVDALRSEVSRLRGAMDELKQFEGLARWVANSAGHGINSGQRRQGEKLGELIGRINLDPTP